MRSAVFLARDGVLNAEVEGPPRRPPWSLAELELLPGVPTALNRLAGAGFALLVVTNQPDVARGDLPSETLQAISDRLLELLPLHGVYACTHDNTDGCGCRKPAPGLITRAATECDIDLESSWLVGDRWVDIAAARAAGIPGLLVETPRSWLPSSAGSPPKGLRPDGVFTDLDGAVSAILASLEGRPAGR